MNNKTITKFTFLYDVKIYADLGGCYPPQPLAPADNTLVDLYHPSFFTQRHLIIVFFYLSKVNRIFFLLTRTKVRQLRRKNNE